MMIISVPFSTANLSVQCCARFLTRDIDYRHRLYLGHGACAEQLACACEERCVERNDWWIMAQEVFAVWEVVMLVKDDRWSNKFICKEQGTLLCCQITRKIALTLIKTLAANSKWNNNIISVMIHNERNLNSDRITMCKISMVLSTELVHELSLPKLQISLTYENFTRKKRRHDIHTYLYSVDAHKKSLI